ncbi:MAG: hypothetical protein IJT15_00685 [Rickettsiales bacterium]|nr:hypothetical protein [Rickettsiales bacterium]
MSEENAKKINFDITININSQTKKNITICMVCYKNKIFQGFFFEKQGIFCDEYNKRGSHYLSQMQPVQLIYSLYTSLLNKMFNGNNLTDNEKKACAISLMRTYSNLKERGYIIYTASKNMQEYLNKFFFPLVAILRNTREYEKIEQRQSEYDIRSLGELEDFNKKFNNFCSQNTQNLYNGKLHNNGLKLRNVDNNITNIDNNIIFEPKNIVNNNSLQTKITFHQQNQQSGAMKEGDTNNQKNKEEEQEKSYKQEDEEKIIANDKEINLHNQEIINTSQGQKKTISGNQTKQGKQQKECYLFKNNSLQTKITFHQQNQQSEVMKEDNANKKNKEEQEKQYKQEDKEEIITNNKEINLNNKETITALQGQNETISGNQTKQGKQQKECYLFEYLNISNCCKICQNEEELQKNKSN